MIFIVICIVVLALFILSYFLPIRVNSIHGSARFSNSNILKSTNKGLVINGHQQRLSLQDSCRHAVIISSTGGGKTTSFILPNIIDLLDISVDIGLKKVNFKFFMQKFTFSFSKA